MIWYDFILKNDDQWFKEKSAGNHGFVHSKDRGFM